MERLEFDVLIIGSGAAGSYAAMQAAELGAKVAVVTKTKLLSGSTRWAQGGVAFPSNVNDISSHLRDTVTAGRGLVDANISNTILTDGLYHLEKLIKLGMSFDAIPALEGGHSIPRVRHVNGDESGLHLLTFLHGQLSGEITKFEQHYVAQLLSGSDSIFGALVWPGGNQEQAFEIRSHATIIATGGAGQLYQVTTNPPESTGDGIALAYRAGAQIRDMELVQFHPTVLANGRLISEACRGEGAVLITRDGTRFMENYDPAGELAPRDTVARAIYNQEKISGQIYVDLRPIKDLKTQFPTVFASVASLGIDPTKEPVPIYPAAHYLMGGITSDEDGMTSLGSLFAAGEAASTGFHGANRLASNSLLESIVMGSRAAKRAVENGQSPKVGNSFQPSAVYGAPLKHKGEIKQIMSTYASVEREHEGLLKGFSEISNIFTSEATDAGQAEVANLRILALMVFKGAMERKESRGSHFRSDYPQTCSNASHVEFIISDPDSPRD